MKRTLQLQLDITADHLADLVGQVTGEKKQEMHAFTRHARRLLNLLPGTAEVIRMSGTTLHVTWVPQGEEIPLARLASLLEGGQYIQAIFLMELLLSSDAKEPGLLYNLGMAYSDMGKLERAQQLLGQLLAIEPDNINGRVAYGVALMRTGDALTAEEQLRIAVDQDPTNPWANRNLGAVLLNLNRPADAIPYMRTAAEHNPQDERAWFGLGQALELAGELSEADAAYVTALEINERQ